MKSFFTKLLAKIPEFTNYLLAALVVLLISSLFPNNVKFKYNFAKGQTWTYADLRSPFDFPIKKTDQEIEKEIALLDKNFHPYYVYNSELISQKKNDFTQLVQSKIAMPYSDSLYKDIVENEAAYLRFGLSLIDSIYRKGIIKLDLKHLESESDFVINVLEKNTSKKRPLSSLYTTRTVNQPIVDMLADCGFKNCQFLLDPIQKVLAPNLIYSDSITQQLYKQSLANDITYSRGMVKKDQVIIRRQGIITDEIHQELTSFKEAYKTKVTQDKSANWIFFGYFLLTSLIMGVFVAFVKGHNPTIFRSLRQWIFLLMWLILFSYAVYLAVKYEMISLYVLPFCIVPIIIKNFYNARLALFTHIIVILIASFLSPLGYEFTFVQILAGIVVVLANVRTRYISKFFISIFYLFLVYQGAYLGLSLIEEGSIERLSMGTHGFTHGWLAMNVFLTLISYPLIPLIEKVFGFTSEITLVELSDMDKPLLRELSINAPGTLQHSLQVANLSEAAAKEIGANSLLVKVAALYHDIGKMIAPLNFIENQNGQNPHDEMDETQSAKAIIDHVTEGVKMAKKEGLPWVIINFIKTHHGTTRVEYFYRNYQKNNPDETIDESLFRYPGPNPKTKEESILMVADSVEAASKSLRNPTEQSINDIVDKIVNSKIENKQFVDSELSFEELESCKRVFKKLLKSIHHVRIEYPEEIKPSKTE